MAVHRHGGNHVRYCDCRRVARGGGAGHNRTGGHSWFGVGAKADYVRTFGRTLGRMAAVCLVVTLIVGWQVTWEKFRQPEPAHIRQELFLSSMAMIADRPWTGFGL